MNIYNFPSGRSDSDPHVRDCIRSYTADYTVSNRNYEKYSSQHVAGPWTGEREGTPRINQRQEYEVDVEETGSQSDRVSTVHSTWWGQGGNTQDQPETGA